MNKAEQVDDVYYTAAWDNNTHSEGCYSLAVHAAIELGGVEVQNANDGEGSKSFAPSRTFEFDDSSSIYIMCGGTYVIEPSAWVLKVAVRIDMELTIEAKYTVLVFGYVWLEMISLCVMSFLYM